MDAVAADPAFRRSAGHDQPQPLPRPGQRHRAIGEIEIAQPGRLPRIAKAEGEFRLALAAEFDAVQRLAFGVEQGDAGSGGRIVDLSDDLKQARPGGGHARHRCLSGVLRREFDATVAQFLKAGARGQSLLPRKRAGRLPSSTMRCAGEISSGAGPLRKRARSCSVASLGTSR